MILENTEKCSLMASRFSVFFIKFNHLQQFLFLQLPKGDCTGSGDIEGVDASGHGDNDIVIYRLKGRQRESISLVAQNNGESFFGFEYWIVNGNGIVN